MAEGKIACARPPRGGRLAFAARCAISHLSLDHYALEVKDMTQQHIMREHLYTVIMDKVSTEADSRKEALSDFFAVTGTVVDARADKVAELVPPVLPNLYDKWVNMFLDRLFETMPAENIELIADGTEENNAAAVLAYIMFLESERMEKQIAEDLKSYGLEHTGDEDMGDLAAQYIRASMDKVAGENNAAAPGKDAKAKAAAYKRRQRAKKAKK